MKKKLWYAVSGSGKGCVFTTYPVRDDHYKVWKGEIVGMYCDIVCQFEAEGLLSLPVLSWKDEPIAIELKLNVINAPCGQEKDG